MTFDVQLQTEPMTLEVELGQGVKIESGIPAAVGVYTPSETSQMITVMHNLGIGSYQIYVWTEDDSTLWPYEVVFCSAVVDNDGTMFGGAVWKPTNNATYTRHDSNKDNGKFYPNNDLTVVGDDTRFTLTTSSAGHKFYAGVPYKWACINIG